MLKQSNSTVNASPQIYSEFRLSILSALTDGHAKGYFWRVQRFVAQTQVSSRDVWNAIDELTKNVTASLNETLKLRGGRELPLLYIPSNALIRLSKLDPTINIGSLIAINVLRNLAPTIDPSRFKTPDKARDFKVGFYKERNVLIEWLKKIEDNVGSTVELKTPPSAQYFSHIEMQEQVKGLDTIFDSASYSKRGVFTGLIPTIRGIWRDVWTIGNYRVECDLSKGTVLLIDRKVNDNNPLRKALPRLILSDELQMDAIREFFSAIAQAVREQIETLTMAIPLDESPQSDHLFQIIENPDKGFAVLAMISEQILTYFSNNSRHFPSKDELVKILNLSKPSLLVLGVTKAHINGYIEALCSRGINPFNTEIKELEGDIEGVKICLKKEVVNAGSELAALYRVIRKRLEANDSITGDEFEVYYNCIDEILNSVRRDEEIDLEMRKDWRKERYLRQLFVMGESSLYRETVEMEQIIDLWHDQVIRLFGEWYKGEMSL